MVFPRNAKPHQISALNTGLLSDFFKSFQGSGVIAYSLPETVLGRKVCIEKPYLI